MGGLFASAAAWADSRASGDVRDTPSRRTYLATAPSQLNVAPPALQTRPPRAPRSTLIVGPQPADRRVRCRPFLGAIPTEPLDRARRAVGKTLLKSPACAPACSPPATSVQMSRQPITGAIPNVESVRTVRSRRARPALERSAAGECLFRYISFQPSPAPQIVFQIHPHHALVPQADRHCSHSEISLSQSPSIT